MFGSIWLTSSALKPIDELLPIPVPSDPVPPVLPLPIPPCELPPPLLEPPPGEPLTLPMTCAWASIVINCIWDMVNLPHGPGNGGRLFFSRISLGVIELIWYKRWSITVRVIKSGSSRLSNTNSISFHPRSSCSHCLVIEDWNLVATGTTAFFQSESAMTCAVALE